MGELDRKSNDLLFYPADSAAFHRANARTKGAVNVTDYFKSNGTAPEGADLQINNDDYNAAATFTASKLQSLIDGIAGLPSNPFDATAVNEGVLGTPTNSVLAARPMLDLV